MSDLTFQDAERERYIRKHFERVGLLPVPAVLPLVEPNRYGPNVIDFAKAQTMRRRRRGPSAARPAQPSMGPITGGAA
jgi:hypothetical protein